MKRFLQAYTSFTRTERIGIVVLLVIIVVLLMIKATMHLWVNPDFDSEQQAKLIRSWEAYKARSVAKAPKINAVYPHKDTHVHTPKIKNTESAVIPHHKLFSFDPNTVDSATLRKLGLREKTTSIFLHWRAKGKVFYNKEEFKKVYTLTPEEYERLEPYIAIDKAHLKKRRSR